MLNNWKPIVQNVITTIYFALELSHFVLQVINLPHLFDKASNHIYLIATMNGNHCLCDRYINS